MACCCRPLDRAFDRGLITVAKGQKVLVSRHLRENPSQPTRDFFGQFDGMNLRPALRFDPEPQFLEWHNENCFIDASAG
jgi:predicted restriction endonuclease